MKRLLFLIAVVLPILAFGGSTYRPLLEEGKEWRYTGVWNMLYNNPDAFDFLGDDAIVEEFITYRLLAPEDRDGNKWYPLLKVEDGEVIGYLREDVDEKKVWAINDLAPFYDYFADDMQYDDEYLLYDFADLDNCAVTIKLQHTGEVELDTYDESVTVPSYGHFAIAPGIGIFVTNRPDWNRLSGADLLGVVINPYTGYFSPIYAPFLYEVVLADGTVVYSNINYAPGLAASGSIKVDDQMQINTANGMIVISGATANEARIYDMQGRLLKADAVSDGNALIQAPKAAGLYIIHCGDAKKKISIE